MSFPYELSFPQEKQYSKLHKIRTNKDIAKHFFFFFFFEKPKKLYTFQKSVFKELKKNMKNLFFHLWAQCAKLIMKALQQMCKISLEQCVTFARS